MMLNRLVSNFVLGFFVVVLVVVYGVAKQAPTYQLKQPTQTAGAQTKKQVADEANNPTVAGMEAREVVGFSTVVLPNGFTVNAKVANSDATRKQGLSGTEPLQVGEGMLFVFDKADRYGIWMKEMKYDLDIIWMDETGKVVHLVEGAKAPTSPTQDLEVYKNAEPALYVLELPSGTAGPAGIGVGTVLAIS